MTILSQTGRICLVREPVCGRFGMPRMLARLSSDGFGTSWDGREEITVVTFNKRCTMCRILHLDEAGCDFTTRVLNQGRFKVMLTEGLIPKMLTRGELERLLIDGTLEGDYQHAGSETLLRRTGTA